MDQTATTREQDKSTATLKRRSNPRPMFPPVLVFVIAIAAGIGVNLILPRSIAPGNLIRIISGIVIFLGGVWLWVLAWRAFRRHGESFAHRYSTQTVVTDGPYSISRHPAYIAYLLIGIGLGLFRDNPWILLMMPFAFWYVATFAARREERYLMSKYEEIYQRYRMEVRRWI